MRTWRPRATCAGQIQYIQMNHTHQHGSTTHRMIAWCTGIGCLALGSLVIGLADTEPAPLSREVAAELPEPQRFGGQSLIVAHAHYEVLEADVERQEVVPEIVGTEPDIEATEPIPHVPVARTARFPAYQPWLDTADSAKQSTPKPYGRYQSAKETRDPPVVKRPPDAKKPPAPKTLQGKIVVEGRVTNGVSFGIEQDGEWAWYYLRQGGDYNTRMVPWVAGRVALVAGVMDVAAKLPDNYLWLKPYRKGASLKLDITLQVSAVTFAMTVGGGPAGGMAMSLDGRLPDGANCQFRPTTDRGGRFKLDMPECSFSIQGEHLNHGTISKSNEQIASSGVRPYSLIPLVVASGHADPRDFDVQFGTGTMLEFERASGGPTAIKRRVGFLGLGARRTFRIEGLLPGKYRVTLFPGQRFIGGGGRGQPRRLVNQNPVRLQSLNLLTSNEGIVLRR
jgi:hypothetical protein